MFYIIKAEVESAEYSELNGFGEMVIVEEANSEEEAKNKLIGNLSLFKVKINSVKEYYGEIGLVEKAKSELSNFNSFQLPRNPRYVVELAQNDRMVLIRPTFISYEVFRNLINAYANDYQNFFNVLDDIQFDVKDFVKTDKYTVTLKKYSGIGELMETHVLECNV